VSVRSKTKEDKKQTTAGDDGGFSKLIKDFGVIGISKMLVSVAGIILIPFLTKILGEHDYGLWAQMTATLAILTTIIRLGLPFSMVRLFPSKKDIKEISKDFSSITFLIIFVSLPVSISLLLFPSFLANAIFEENTLIVKILGVLLFIGTIDRLLLTVFRAFREMKKHAILEVLTKYGEISLAIVLVLMGYGLIGAIIALVLVRSVMFFVLVTLVSRKLKFAIPKFKRTKEYLSFGIPLVPTDLSAWTVKASDRLLIGFFLSATFVGYYVPAYTLGIAVPFLLGTVMSFVLTPTFSKYYDEGDMSKIYLITKYCVKYFLVISILYSIGVILFGKQFLEIFTTTAIAENGYIILVFTAVVGLFKGFYSLFSRFVLLKKRTKFIAFIFLISSVVNLIGNILLIPRLGIVGAATTTLISYIILFAFVVHFSFKNFEIKLDYNYIPSLLICSILTFLFIYASIHYLTITNIFLDIFLGSIFYLFAIWTFKIITKKEINLLKRMVGF